RRPLRGLQLVGGLRISLRSLLHLIKFFLDILNCSFDRALPLRLGHLLEKFVHRGDVRNLERLVRRNIDVRLDSGPFPVGFADGIDRSSAWNPYREVLVDSPRPSRMRPATSRLAHDRCSLEILEIVSELFRR